MRRWSRDGLRSCGSRRAAVEVAVSHLLEATGAAGSRSQALAKLQRRHDRDLADVRSMVQSGLIRPTKLRGFFASIEHRSFAIRRSMRLASA